MEIDYLNKLVDLSLQIANYVDNHGRNGDTELADKLNLGYRALSSYLRRGATAVINIQTDYQVAIEKREYAELSESEMKEFLEDIFGTEEPETLNDEYKHKIREFVAELLEDDSE